LVVIPIVSREGAARRRSDRRFHDRSDVLVRRCGESAAIRLVLWAAPARYRRGLLSWLMVELQSYELVFLRRPPDRPDFDDATTERLQREHLAFHQALRDSGDVVTNGPLRDQPDESLRGLTFYRTGSLKETRRLAEHDPWVEAGGLVIDVVTWWCPAGTMVKPGRPVKLK
jgi:uncharacterized protein YciI